MTDGSSTPATAAPAAPAAPVYVVPNAPGIANKFQFWRGYAWDWASDAVERLSSGVFTALLATWTGLPLALWPAAIVLVLGIVAGLWIIYHLFLAGTVMGTVGRLAGALVSGLVIAIATMVVIYVLEPVTLRLRGYRQLSRRERARVEPALTAAGRKMGLKFVPAVWVSDSLKPAAWSHIRAIVVTRGLLGEVDETERPPVGEIDDAALGAILAHELHHWRVGDPLALSFVWCCCWPLLAAYNLAAWLTGAGLDDSVRRRFPFLGFLAWIVFWPAWVVVPLITFVMAKDVRKQEFEADAHVAALGDEYRLGMRRALAEVSAWEKPRTGWEDVLAGTHPPIELRLERLEAA
jgi:Zn-dependent protease with chaperone function